MGGTVIAVGTLVWLGIVETKELGKGGELNMEEINK